MRRGEWHHGQECVHQGNPHVGGRRSQKHIGIIGLQRRR